MNQIKEVFRRSDKRLMLVIGVILFGLFILFSYLVAKEKFTQLDFDMTVKFQDRIPRRLDYIFSWFSVVGSVEVTGIIWLGVLVFTLIKRFWLSALSLFLLPAALAIEVFGKVFVTHPAPPFMFYRGVVNIEFPKYFVHDLYSYPSGHETRSAFLIIFLMSLVFFRKNHQVKVIVIPALLGFLAIMTVSRVYLGEHWTTDVIGGFLVGASFGLLSGATIPKKLNLHNS